MVSISTILLGHNDAQYIGRVAQSILDQTVQTEIVYVDDCSSDRSAEIIRDLGIRNIVYLTRKKRTFGGVPILAENVNAGLARIGDPDFFMVMPSDVKLEKQYVEKLLAHFREDRKLVVASGSIIGEYSKKTAPRGAGRITRKSFWNRHIQQYPHSFLWESYPVWKAMSLGYHTKCVRDVWMLALRPTRPYKPLYGYAMKELGYSKIYAYMRIFKALLYSPKTGIGMLYRYWTNLEPLDPDLAEYVSRRQILELANHIRNLDFSFLWRRKR